MPFRFVFFFRQSPWLRLAYAVSSCHMTGNFVRTLRLVRGISCPICLCAFHRQLKQIQQWVYSVLNRSLMVRWAVRSILHGVDPLSYFSFQPVLHDWCNKGRGMCYPVCGMVHIKEEPLLLIEKISPCGGSGFNLSLSEWTFTICPTPYNHK